MNKEKTNFQCLENFKELTSDQELNIQAGESVVEKVVNTISEFFIDVFKR